MATPTVNAINQLLAHYLVERCGRLSLIDRPVDAKIREANTAHSRRCFIRRLNTRKFTSEREAVFAHLHDC